MKSTCLIAAAAFTLLMAPDAQAASCSGSNCNDKDPVATGCGSGFIAPGTPGNHWGNMVHAPGCARGEVLYVDSDGIHRTARLASSDC